MAEEAQVIEETQVETETVDNSDNEIANLSKQITEIKQKLVDATEEAMRRRKTNERLKSELETLQNKPVEQADNNNEAILAQFKSQYEEKEKAHQSIVNDLVKKNAVNELKTALIAQNIDPIGANLLLPFAESRFQIDEVGNIRIMSSDLSKPLAGTGSDGYATSADLAKELAASQEGQRLVKDTGISGGGKPPASQGGNAGSKTMPDAEFRKLSQKARWAFLNQGGRPI